MDFNFLRGAVLLPAKRIANRYTDTYINNTRRKEIKRKRKYMSKTRIPPWKRFSLASSRSSLGKYITYPITDIPKERMHTTRARNSWIERSGRDPISYCGRWSYKTLREPPTRNPKSREISAPAQQGFHKTITVIFLRAC